MSISFTVGPHRIRFAGKTDIGQVRSQNEDSILVPSEMALAVVSDGMGGHACGDVASQITVETLDEFYRESAKASPPTWPLKLPTMEVERHRMATGIKLANLRIFETASADAGKKGMGCTVVAMYFHQGRFYVGHVGDSRVYRIREQRIGMLTEDHSLANDYMRMREMTAEEMKGFPQKNVVVRALGLAEQVAVDVIIDEYRTGDVFLLCSDGLCGMISDEAMLQIIAGHESLDMACSSLIRAANDAGGNDNISAVLVRVERP
ncbi:MAG TPA: Stp1/IreP family PP2C-type Ser/Thr phosphatase [Nannocystaceae bacterium]|nr:Stp1/IreP family PP2C-type Ser/Thr phosphatase [Nannocystaceae bacterium]